MTSANPWSFTSTGHCNVSTLDETPRIYLVHIPPSYTPDKPYPLVLSFHGRGSNPKEQETITGLSQPGLKINNTEIVAVYPQGLPGEEGKLAWQGAPYAAPGVDDISFTQEILSAVQVNLSIDPKRIYVTGMSNGGGFTNLIARTLSVAQHIAAFAAGSAALYPGTLPGIPIGPTPPSAPISSSLTKGTTSDPETPSGVPFLETHGTADHIVPYDGRSANKEGNTAYRLPDIQAWRAAWALRNGFIPHSSPPSDLIEIPPAIVISGPGIELPPPTSVTNPFPKTTLYTWKCVGGADILGYTIDGMGHTWVTEPPESFNATTDVILPFFEQHPLPN